MCHFVTQDRCQPIVVCADWQNASEDEDLAAGQDKSILGVLVIDHIDLDPGCQPESGKPSAETKTHLPLCILALV